MDLKKRIIDDIIKVEGGYVNNPNDNGGATRFGITIAVARAHGWLGSMQEFPEDKAFDIYSQKYWDSIQGDEIIELSEIIAEEVVDTAVNMGPGRAGLFLQRSLNALNNRESLYPDLKIDGAIGIMTVTALAKYLRERDAETLAKMLNCLQGAFYVDLVERREKDETFIYGWFKNRVKL